MQPAYWSYKAIPGMENEEQQRGAVEEGRRAKALELATAGNYTWSSEEALIRAAKFEAYLKGEAPVSVVETTEYESLVARSNHLLVLEAAGVDSWEGYVGG